MYEPSTSTFFTARYGACRWCLPVANRYSCLAHHRTLVKPRGLPIRKRYHQYTCCAGDGSEDYIRPWTRHRKKVHHITSLPTISVFRPTTTKEAPSYPTLHMLVTIAVNLCTRSGTACSAHFVISVRLLSLLHPIRDIDS